MKNLCRQTPCLFLEQQKHETIIVPYIRGLSETLKLILAEVNVCAVY